MAVCFVEVTAKSGNCSIPIDLIDRKACKSKMMRECAVWLTIAVEMIISTSFQMKRSVGDMIRCFPNVP